MPTKAPEQLKLLLIEAGNPELASIRATLEQCATPFQCAGRATLPTPQSLRETGDFDLLLIELDPAEGSGTDFTERLAPLSLVVPTIVLIPEEDAALDRELRRAGAQDCLCPSGLQPATLEKALHNALERAELQKKLYQAESAQQKSDALLRKIFHTSHDALLVLSADYRIQFFNPAAAKLLDTSEADLIDATFPFEIGSGKDSEFEISDAEGDIRMIELSADSISWGGETGRVVILRDITEQKQAEVRLSAERARLQVALDCMDAFVVLTDGEGRIESVNRKAAELTGRSSESVAGQFPGKLLRLENPESGTPLSKGWDELHRREFLSAYNQTGLLLKVPGGTDARRVRAETRSSVEEDGARRSSITVLRDITKQRQAAEKGFSEEQLNSISLMVGGIAHDFNNILTSIMGNISVARMRMDNDPENTEQLLAAEKGALQATALTDQLLNFAKGGALERKVTDIAELVEESAKLILRGRSDATCQIRKQDELWPVDVDRSQIAQVINNLVINADQAMPEGGTVEIKMNNRCLSTGEVADLKAGDYVSIAVRDEGTGIRPKNLDRVFDPYFTTKKEGNGLGLASSFSIIKSHGGLIMAESEYGQGSRFTVFLPKSAKVRPKEPPKDERPAPVDSDQVDLTGKRILLMDDMEDMMLVARDILSVLGCEVTCTKDGKEAIDAYRSARASGEAFDAVVFDLTVPGGMGGEEAANQILKEDPNLRAVASSGYTDSNIMADVSGSSFRSTIPKPYRIKEMREALQRVL